MTPFSAVPDESPDAVVAGLLAELGAEHRRVADGEWGLRVQCAGWPLDVGLRIHHDLLRVQAEAVGPGQVDPGLLLHRNRLGVLVRYAQSAAGAVWVHGEIPLGAVDAPTVDRLLGLLVEAATWVRYAAADDPPPDARRA